MVGKNIAAAQDWILNSGIQNLENEQKGGFNSWYGLNDRKYEFLYSEITGYGISMLLFLNKLNRESILVERAMLAAEWLIQKASHSDGGIKTRHYYDSDDAHPDYSFESGILYAFDNGIVAYGLANLYAATKERRYLDAAQEICQFLISKMQKPNGEFYASYDSKSGKLGDDDAKWSTQSGSYHAKIALAMIELFELTQNPAYRKSAVEVCEAAVKFQEQNGRFVTFRKERDTHIHPHCYSAEGLLYAGIRLNRPDFVASAAKAAKWVLGSLDNDGGINCLYSNSDGGFVTYERSDTIAQTLRLASLLRSRGELSDGGKIEKLKKRLIFFQKKDGIQRGGFYYGLDSGKFLPYLNSWCTMFALQALHMDDLNTGDTEFFV